MQKITPHLWFDTQAKEAAEFYIGVFGEDSKINNVTVLKDTPSGDTDVVSFQLLGQNFMAISAGPLFKFNPSISFHVKCKAAAEVDTLWAKLSEGGTVLMELGTYPWSERYGWVQDKYGLSWQIISVGDAPFLQRITPVLMFVGPNAGKTEEAVNYYTQVFQGSPFNTNKENSKVFNIMRYGAGESPETEGTVKYAAFSLAGQEFGAMDSAREHQFNFNEAISLIVSCDSQEEIDYYWEKLSHVPESEQCGWLKDQWGLSWQITPSAMDKMMQQADEAQMARVTKSFLQMKKFNLAELEKAYKGE